MMVIFVTNKGNEAYNPAKHLTKVWNFLYWKSLGGAGELMIVGDGNYGLKDASHQSLLSCSRKNGCIPPLRVMDGAGNCMEMNGKISGWKSSGFEVVTPKDLRPLILEALGAIE